MNLDYNVFTFIFSAIYIDIVHTPYQTVRMAYENGITNLIFLSRLPYIIGDTYNETVWSERYRTVST